MLAGGARHAAAHEAPPVAAALLVAASAVPPARCFPLTMLKYRPRLPAAVVATPEGETMKLPADVFCCAAGCQYNLNPPFFQEMGVGEAPGGLI